MRTSCIVEVYGGYAYDDYSGNDNCYYKYNVNFRGSNFANFQEVHKTKDSSDRIKFGYRWWGTDNNALGLCFFLKRASDYMISVKGYKDLYYTNIGTPPVDAVWF